MDAEAARRPHGQHTTVVMHLDVRERIAALHLGPLLPTGERRYLTCDATCEVWFERDGEVIGAGRATRIINRRLRRALEHRHPTCAVPGCGATRGLHAHHIRHWEDGGPTELDNLVLLCPYHHRLHHRGVITVTGPAHHLTVTDSDGRVLRPGSLARPPDQPPPAVAPYPGPTGERADWWWYQPFQAQAPRPTTSPVRRTVGAQLTPTSRDGAGWSGTEAGPDPRPDGRRPEMAHSVEGRVPFLDHLVGEYAAGSRSA